jgi:hypothetical protein
MDLASVTLKKTLIIGRTRSCSIHRDDIHAMTSFVEVHFAVHQREKGPITTGSDIGASYEFRSALPNQNAACSDKFTTEPLYTEPFAYAVSSVPDASLTFLVCHILCFNFRDFDPRHFLPMAHRAVVTFAALHLKSDFLLAPEMLHHFGVDRGLGNGRGAYRKLTIIRDEEHPVQHDRFARFCLQPIHFQRFAGSDTVLFSTSFNYSVHKILLSKGAEIPSNRPAGVNASFAFFAALRNNLKLEMAFDAGCLLY